MGSSSAGSENTDQLSLRSSSAFICVHLRPYFSGEWRAARTSGENGFASGASDR